VAGDGTSDGPLARDWLIANFVAALGSSVGALVTSPVRRALGVNTQEAAFSAIVSFVAIETAVSVACFVLYAWLAGRVLQRIIPAFPRRAWMAVHCVLGVVMGGALSVFDIGPDNNEPLEWHGWDMAIFVVLMFAILGVLIGVAWGGLQALALRRAATGLRVWIAASVAMWCLMALLLGAILPFVSFERTFAADAIAAGIVLIIVMLGAVVMLPALRRLVPA